MTDKIKTKKTGGRPKKADEERRDARITGAYTKDEYAIVLERAQIANVSPSAYSRQATLTGKVQAVDVSQGELILIIMQVESHLTHTRADLHKIEREIHSRHYSRANPAPLSDSDIKNIGIAIQNSLVTVNLVLRKVIGFDPC